MTRETGEGGPLDVAIHRLDRAIAQLDTRLTGLVQAAGGHAGELFDQDRAKLAAELDATRKEPLFFERVDLRSAEWEAQALEIGQRVNQFRKCDHGCNPR